MNDRKVTKGVLVGAGFGVRLLPASKNIAKVMLPILDKPIIQYGVEEYVESGIEDIILVSRFGLTQMEDHFDTFAELEEYLEAQGKSDSLEQVRRISKLANFAYVRQKIFHPYGNGTPILTARPSLGNDNFVFGFGDDVTIGKPTPFARQLIEKFEANECDAVIAVQEVPEDQTHKYGIVKLREGSEDEFDQVIEKPAPGSAPSNLAIIGRYVFSSRIHEFMDPNRLGKNNELWLTDVIADLNKSARILIHRTKGKWLTTTDAFHILKAAIEIGLQRDDTKDEITNYIKSVAQDLT